MASVAASKNPKYVSESNTVVNSTCAGSSAMAPPAKIAVSRSNRRRAIRNASAAVDVPSTMLSSRAAFTELPVSL